MTNDNLSEKIFTESSPTGNGPSCYERVVYAKDVREAVKKLKLRTQNFIEIATYKHPEAELISALGNDFSVLIDEIFAEELSK